MFLIKIALGLSPDRFFRPTLRSRRTFDQRAKSRHHGPAVLVAPPRSWRRPSGSHWDATNRSGPQTKIVKSVASTIDVDRSMIKTSHESEIN